MPTLKCNKCDVKTLCTEYLSDAECQHKITDKEIQHAIRHKSRNYSNDFLIFAVLSEEFMSGRQNT